MDSTEDEQKLLLKLTQFKSLIGSDKNGDKKAVDLILQELDLNAKVSVKKNQDNAVIGDVLLHLAYEKKNLDVFTTLIRKGANFNAKDESGSTILHKTFLACVTLNESLNYNNKKHLTDLINTEMLFMHLLLSAHVRYGNTDNPSDPNGLTHFHVACTSTNIEAVELFLSNGVPVNQAVISNGFEEYTPLHFAVRCLSASTANLLLKHGANINLKNRKDMTPLHICVEKNISCIDSPTYSQELINSCEEIMNLMLDHNVHPEFPHLFVVSAMQDSHLTEKLLSQGIHVNESISTDSRIWPGYTALHFAAHVNVDTVKLLIKHGANILTCANNGLTPFDMCVERYKAEDIVDIMHLIPAWKDELLPDGETKLVDLLAALKDLDGIRNFLQKSRANGELFRQPFKSCLWFGYTVLHLTVVLSERAKCKSNYKVRENCAYFEPDLSVITEILNQGADVTVVNNLNWTPIHFAFRTGKTLVLNLLLEYHHRMKNCVDGENLSHLHIACATGNENLVKKLLWNDADANLVYKGSSLAPSIHSGWTPLHIAVSKGNFELTKILLEHGADPHLANANFYTPIHGLLSHVHPTSTQLGRLLLSSLNLQEDRMVEHMGLSYLHVACYAKNVDAVKKLLNLGVDVNKVVAINVKSCNGGTPLHFALANSVSSASRKSKSAELEMLKLLVERGADLLVENSEGFSPLAMVLTSNDHEHLVDAVIATLKSSYSLRKRVEEESGLTLLHLACFRLNLELTKELLDSGVDVNTQVHQESKVWPKCTALHVLLSNYSGPRIRNDDNHNVTIRLLLSRDADVTLTNARQSTALHIAYRLSFVEPDALNPMLVNLLLKAHKNFEVNPTSIGGISHFHIACHALNVEAVKKFLEHDVDVNALVDLSHNSDSAGCSPLLLAVKATYTSHADSADSLTESFAQLEVVKLLIEHGAIVNVEDVSRNTPLHYAATSRLQKQNLLQLLIKSGADVNAKNVQGETPLELLLKSTNSTVEEIRLFLASGCSFNAFNAVTEVGYIALATATISREELLSLLFGSFVNFLSSMRMDEMNRSVIHNVVSIKVPRIDQTEYVDLFDVCMKFGCDIDDQDCLGRTALHLAAQFRNEAAVAGLLLAGADVNITDADGKTPFAYAFEPCSRCRSANMGNDQYKHFGLFKQFAMQILILRFYELHLNESNLVLLYRALERFNGIGLDLGFALVPISRMKLLEIEPCDLTLKDFLHGSVIIDYPTMSPDKRDAIKEFFRVNRSIFHSEFREAPGIFRLQYRQAVLRRKIINEAKDSLSALLRFRLPDICSHIILRFLKNVDLQNLIVSVLSNS